MIRSSRLRWSAAAALVTALALSGCVGSEEKPDADGGSEVASSPSPTSSAAATTEEESDDEADEASSSGDSNSGGQGNSGSNNSGSGGNSGGSNDAGAQTPAPPAAAPEPPAAPSGPTAAVTNQKCTGGKLIVTLTANADNSYRKGITSVTLERQNEYNAWLDSKATWLGPETGQGNQWTGDLPGNQQNIGKTLRVTVVGTTGSTTLTLPVTAPC